MVDTKDWDYLWKSPKYKQKTTARKRPVEVGAIVIAAMLQISLRDIYGFGQERLDRLINRYQAYGDGERKLTSAEVDEECRKKGMDERLFKDFIQRIHKIFEVDDSMESDLGKSPLRTKTDREKFNQSVEVSYKIGMLILNSEFNFSKIRMRRVQEKMKRDMYAILERRVKLIEIMYALNQESSQYYFWLTPWTLKHGGIYGKDGMVL